MHSKVAVYVCHARLSGVLSLCPRVCHCLSSLLYSGHTNAHSLVCDGPDCIHWTSAEVQVGPEPQALSATNATGLGLVLSRENFSQREVLVHQGMEKGKEKPHFWEPEETCQVLPQRSFRNSFPRNLGEGTVQRNLQGPEARSPSPF